MELERVFFKKALSFIILASKSEHVLSAFNFFDKNFCLDDIGKDEYKAEYRDYWASILIDNINLLPQEKRKLVSISFIEPLTSGTGFQLPGDALKYDIIGFKKV